MGAVLPGRERHRVHGGRGGPREDRGVEERAAQLAGEAPAGWHPHPGLGQQAGPGGGCCPKQILQPVVPTSYSDRLLDLPLTQ